MKRIFVYITAFAILFGLQAFASEEQSLPPTTHPNFELLNTGNNTLYYKLFVDKTLREYWQEVEWKPLESNKSERTTFNEMTALVIASDEANAKGLTFKTLPDALKESRAIVIRINRDRSNPEKTFYLSTSITDGKITLNPTIIDTNKPEYKDIPANKNITDQELQKFKERTEAMVQTAVEASLGQ